MYKFTKKKIISVAAFIAIFAAFLGVASINSKRSEISYSLPQNFPVAAWSWQEVSAQDLTYAHDLGIDTLYLSIDEYVDIYELSDSSEKDQKMTAFEQKLTQTLQSAKEKGIAIHALAGNQKWANADYWYLPIELLQFVKKYNKNHPNAPFAGMQYDIEFYNSEEYKKAPENLSQEYLKLLTQLVVIAADQPQDLSLGVTMPYWFDNENGNAPAVVWANKNQPIAFHILDILNMIPHSYTVIMSYRNYTQGDGGAIQISEQEIAYASALSNVSVVIGQETEANEVEKITFYNKGMVSLINALNQISSRFSVMSSFGGAALHTLQGLERLK